MENQQVTQTEITVKDIDELGQTLAKRRKDAVLSIRVNSQDLKAIKERARRMGVRYQTFIGELLHRIAARE